jgi:hypothetical protein
MYKCGKRISFIGMFLSLSIGQVLAEGTISSAKHYATGANNNGVASWLVDFTVRVDKLTIQRTVVNRGNCDSYAADYMAARATSNLPVTLSFGQAYRLETKECNPIEVTITTNQGEQTFTWDQ